MMARSAELTDAHRTMVAEAKSKMLEIAQRRQQIEEKVSEETRREVELARQLQAEIEVVMEAESKARARMQADENARARATAAVQIMIEASTKLNTDSWMETGEMLAAQAQTQAQTFAAQLAETRHGEEVRMEKDVTRALARMEAQAEQLDHLVDVKREVDAEVAVNNLVESKAQVQAEVDAVLLLEAREKYKKTMNDLKATRDAHAAVDIVAQADASVKAVVEAVVLEAKPLWSQRKLRVKKESIWKKKANEFSTTDRLVQFDPMDGALNTSHKRVEQALSPRSQLHQARLNILNRESAGKVYPLGQSLDPTPTLLHEAPLTLSLADEELIRQTFYSFTLQDGALRSSDLKTAFIILGITDVHAMEEEWDKINTSQQISFSLFNGICSRSMQPKLIEHATHGGTPLSSADANLINEVFEHFSLKQGGLRKADLKMAFTSLGITSIHIPSWILSEWHDSDLISYSLFKDVAAASLQALAPQVSLVKATRDRQNPTVQVEFPPEDIIQPTLLPAENAIKSPVHAPNATSIKIMPMSKESERPRDNEPTAGTFVTVSKSNDSLTDGLRSYLSSLKRPTEHIKQGLRVDDSVEPSSDAAITRGSSADVQKTNKGGWGRHRERVRQAVEQRYSP